MNRYTQYSRKKSKIIWVQCEKIETVVEEEEGGGGGERRGGVSKLEKVGGYPAPEEDVKGKRARERF
jgi:hypothetical protein